MKKLKVHFLGIGGSGASAAAAIAQAQGFEITGCDRSPNNEFTTIFKPNQLLTEHGPKHLENIDILAATPAIFSLDPENPELLEAKKLGIPVLTWQQFLGKYLAKDKFIIAVSGTHGKTTTTAMIGLLLEKAGLDPTVILGGIVPRWQSNYRLPTQKSAKQYLVLEADEFNDNFLSVNPDIAVVTNIEMDHPEYFADFEAVKESFKKFLLQTKQTIVANLTEPAVAEVVKYVMKFPEKHTSSHFLDYSKNEMGLNLKIPGEFNRLNAKAAMQVGIILGIDPKIIKQSLESYTGVGRRFEYIGEYNNAMVYSDFGHHPTEIQKTMEAAREKFPHERILLIYQPHMFSRTKALFNDFVRIFKQVPADQTFIIDIYPSRETDTGLTSSKELVEATNKPTVSYLGSAVTTLEKIKPQIRPGDIIFFMSAGDTDKLAKELVSSS